MASHYQRHRDRQWTAALAVHLRVVPTRGPHERRQDCYSDGGCRQSGLEVTRCCRQGLDVVGEYLAVKPARQQQSAASSGQVGLDACQDAAGVIVGILCDQQPGARRRDDGDTATAALERVADAGHLVQVSDGHLHSHTDHVLCESVLPCTSTDTWTHLRAPSSRTKTAMP